MTCANPEVVASVPRGRRRGRFAMAVAFLIPEKIAVQLRKENVPVEVQRAQVFSNSVHTTSTPGFQSGRLFASGMAMMAFAGVRRKKFQVSKEATSDVVETAKGESNNEYAYKMVKIAGLVTVLPFLFCLGNFFYDPALSDFSLEYGPHLAHPALRTTSVVQAILVFSAVLWREKYRSDPIDRLFAWLFVPEAATHILLHWFSHYHAFANFAFAYAFSAGIALPGFLSLLCYVPKEKKLPWVYLALYMITQIPIVAGLTNMVGPAKMRLNYANINTAWITTPFFYGILKRWKDVPKAPVVLATLTISYQVAMGIMGPITGATDLKLYDPSCIFQHGVVDIGFGIAYAVSIVCGVFRPKVPRPVWDWEHLRRPNFNLPDDLDCLAKAWC